MSKLFRQAQDTQKWTAGQAPPPNLNIERLLDSVKAGDAIAENMAVSRLEHCRKFHLSSVHEPTLLQHRDGATPEMEAYRALRTRLIRAQGAAGVRSILISSASQNEGKTLTSLNLALCWTQLPDARILLVDGDLRTRGLSMLFGCPPGPGLSDILSGHTQYAEGILATQWPNLHVLGAGSVQESPAELYSSPKWNEFIGWCGESFKVVLVDAPPILPLTDFELMSAGCDGVLVIVRALSTQREQLEKAKKILDPNKILGVVLNDTDIGQSSRYSSYYSTSPKSKAGV